MACEYQGAKETDEGYGQNVDESEVIGFPNGRGLVIHSGSRPLKAVKQNHTGKSHSQRVSIDQR